MSSPTLSRPGPPPPPALLGSGPAELLPPTSPATRPTPCGAAGARPALRLTLLGPFDLSREGGGGSLEGRGVRALLALLALARGRPVPRGALATDLWGDRGSGRAHKALRQTLWQLQTQLRLLGAPAGLVEVTPEWVRLGPGPALSLDTEAMSAALAEVRSAGGGEDVLDGEVLARATGAAALYRGELLEGWLDDWCEGPREDYRALYVELQERLLAHHLALGDPRRALEVAGQLLAADPAREHVHRRLMRLHLDVGDRTAALRQYVRCEEALRRELGARPGPDTTRLYEELLHGASIPQPEEPAPLPSVTLEEVAALLAQVGALLERWLAAAETPARRSADGAGRPPD